MSGGMRMKRWQERYGIGFVLSIMVLMGIIGIGVGRVYKNQPIFQVQSYIKALNERDFDLVYQYFYKDKHISNRKKQEIITCMESYFSVDNFVKIELSSLKGKDYNDKRTNAKGKYFEVNYLFKDKLVASGISLVKKEDRWEVLFPFKMTDVTVDAPLGATVYFNGKRVEKGVDGEYIIKSVLPGEHKVRIELYESDYSNYEATLKVPQQKQVTIPYETLRVKIKTKKNMIVELAGEKKVNKDGTIFFDDVLEGIYEVKVIDPYGDLETWSQTVDISKANNTFEMKALDFSEKGRDNVKAYIRQFYNVYHKGIEEKSSAFLDHYVTNENKLDVKESFENWFIKNKNIKDAQLKFDIQHIDITKEGYLTMTVLEQVSLLNQEMNPRNEAIDRYYKVVMKSHIVLEPVGKSYVIVDKKIEESLVSYKDEDGKWIAY